MVQGNGTMEIIIGMRSLLDLMKSGNISRYGSLMEKALNYLDRFGARCSCTGRTETTR